MNERQKFLLELVKKSFTVEVGFTVDADTYDTVQIFKGEARRLIKQHPDIEYDYLEDCHILILGV